jgi:hypothetical protein
MTSSDDAETILFHNINGMKDDTNWYQIIATMKELNIEIFGFAEINRSLHHGYKQEWKETIRKIFYFSRTTTSEINKYAKIRSVNHYCLEGFNVAWFGLGVDQPSSTTRKCNRY